MSRLLNLDISIRLESSSGYSSTMEMFGRGEDKAVEVLLGAAAEIARIAEVSGVDLSSVFKKAAP